MNLWRAGAPKVNVSYFVRLFSKISEVCKYVFGGGMVSEALKLYSSPDSSPQNHGFTAKMEYL